MRIGYVTTDSWPASAEDPTLVYGPTSWVRCFLPASKLDAPVCSNLAVAKDGALLPVDSDGTQHEVDVLVLQRWMAPVAAEATKRAVAAGQIVINDLDDWFLGIPPTNRAAWATHPRYDTQREWMHNRAGERAAQRRGEPVPPSQGFDRNAYMRGIAAGSAITVSTEYLAERMGQHFSLPIFTLRNAIDTSRYEIEDVTDGPVVGWAGAPLWRGADLPTLAGILGPYLDRHDYPFVHAGHLETADGTVANGVQGTVADQLKIDPARLTPRPLVDIKDYPALLKGLDIGLVPLEDSPFNRAKSCLKGMEYAAAGIPFVAQALPEYEWFGAGITARKPKDWIRALERLTDPIERKQIGADARARVELEDISVRWTDWRDVYEQLT